jgi:hypothetical protein
VIKLELLMGLVTFALWVYCLVNVITTDESRMRHLPKVAWVLLVLLFPLVGSIAWLVAGRPESAPRRPATGAVFPEYERPGRFSAADPEKDEEFLRQVRERAEEQRRRYEAEKRAREEQGDEPETTA